MGIKPALVPNPTIADTVTTTSRGPPRATPALELPTAPWLESTRRDSHTPAPPRKWVAATPPKVATPTAWIQRPPRAPRGARLTSTPMRRDPAPITRGAVRVILATQFRDHSVIRLVLAPATNLR